MRRREPLPLRTLGLVAVGAALGAVARYAATLAWPECAVAAANIVGTLALGVLWGLRSSSGAAPRPRRGAFPFLGTGFCGGFTTFSTVMIASLDTEPAAGLATMAAQLVGAMAAAGLGWWAVSAAGQRGGR